MKFNELNSKKQHPVQEGWQDVADFGKEVGSGVADVARGTVDFATAAAKDFVDPESYKRDLEAIKRGAKFVKRDPVGAAKYAAQSTDDFVRAMANQATFGGADYAQAATNKLLGSEQDRKTWEKNRPKEPWTGSYEQYKAVQDMYSGDAEERSPTATAIGDFAGVTASLPFAGGARASLNIAAKGTQKLAKIPKGGKALKTIADVGTATVGGVAAEKGTSKAVKKYDPDNPYLREAGPRPKSRIAPAPHTTPHGTSVDLNIIPPSAAFTKRQWKRMSTADRQAAWDAHAASSAPPAAPSSAETKASELADKYRRFKYGTTDPRAIADIKSQAAASDKPGFLSRTGDTIVKTAMTHPFKVGVGIPVAGGVLGSGLYNWKNDPNKESLPFHLMKATADPVRGLWTGLGKPGETIGNAAGRFVDRVFGDNKSKTDGGGGGGGTGTSSNNSEPGFTDSERSEPLNKNQGFGGGSSSDLGRVPDISGDSRPFKEAAEQDVSSNKEAVSQFLRNMVRRESGGQNIQNLSGSKAYGLFQFMPSTFNNLVKRATPDSPLYGKTWEQFKADVNVQKEAMKTITKSYLNALNSNKIQVTPASLYMLHFFGPTGIKMMKSSPDTSLSAIFPPTKNPKTGKLEPSIVFKQNRNLKPNQTVGDVYKNLHSAMMDAPENVISKNPRLQQQVNRATTIATDVLSLLTGSRSAQAADEVPKVNTQPDNLASQNKPTVKSQVKNKDEIPINKTPDTTPKVSATDQGIVGADIAKLSGGEFSTRADRLNQEKIDAILGPGYKAGKKETNLALQQYYKQNKQDQQVSKKVDTTSQNKQDTNASKIDFDNVMQRNYPDTKSAKTSSVSSAEKNFNKADISVAPLDKDLDFEKSVASLDKDLDSDEKSTYDKVLGKVIGQDIMTPKERSRTQVPESINTELQDILWLAGKAKR